MKTKENKGQNITDLIISYTGRTIFIFTVLTLFSTSTQAQSWSTSGNVGTGAEFIGTLNSQSLRLVTKGKTRMKISSVGKVAIGVFQPLQKLDVGGAIRIGNTSDLHAGSIRWTGTDFEGYDGSGWSSLTSIPNIYSDGSFVGIGTSTPVTGYQFAVDGKIICEEVKVQMSASWPDYVFSNEYELMSLNSLRSFIEEHGHLPGVPDATTVESEGLSVSEMSRVMMEKIEELTLHLLEQAKRIDQLEKQNAELKEKAGKI
jgi:hypothetical protein